MKTFNDLLQRAPYCQASAVELIDMYRPLIMKLAIVDGEYDEDLYQELIETFLISVKTFKP